MKRWTENQDQLLTNMAEDKIAEKDIYVADLNRPWPAIKARAKHLNLDMSFIPDGRLVNGKKRQDKLEQKGSPENTPTITQPERIDYQSAALLAADFYFSKLIQLKEKGGG